MQDFPTKSPSEEIPTQADNFSQTPDLFTWKFAEAVPSPKKLPTSRLIRKACIYMVSVKHEHELQTLITRSEMKELLILCTKNVHFMFDNAIKVCSSNGVAMGSPLGPVLSDIFMIELETSFLPELTDYIQFWKRYVDDTICFL